MILNNRQTAILYELIDSNDYLSYSYLCNRFMVIEKTIRIDIRKLNDFLSQYDIQILLKKGNGFFLKCTPEKRDKLMANFDYRYKDSSEVHSSYHKNDLSIIYYLSKGPIKEEKLAEKLNVSVSLITKALKEIRNRIKGYNLTLTSKPYKGLMLEGNEINIRNYIIDSVSFVMPGDIKFLFNDNAKTFNVSEDLVNDLKQILYSSIRTYKINISHQGISVIILAIVFSLLRTDENFDVEFSEQQKELINSFIYFDKYNSFIDEIEKKTYKTINSNDRYFIISYAMLLNDYNETAVDRKYLNGADRYANELMNVFDEYKICDSNELPVFKTQLRGIIENVLIRKQLGFVETYFNNGLRTALINSSLSMIIGIFIYNRLEKNIEYKPGDYILLTIVHSVYYQIRDIVRTKKLCNIAVFSPMYTAEGFTVADRIEYHCGRFINRVDVINSTDLVTRNVNDYDLFVYFGDYEPDNSEITIDKQKVSYYFSNKDRNELYDRLCLMTRFYKNCFGSLRKEDIIENNNEVSGLYSVVQYVKRLCKDDELLLEQLEQTPLTSLLVYKDTFNIILFTDRNDLKTTKLIKLNKPIKYNDQSILRVMINIINSSNSAINIKTIENVIRKMSEHITYNIENVDLNDDLFRYYIKDAM